MAPHEAEHLEKDGVVPNCRDHRHTSRRAAAALVSTPWCGGRRAARVVLPMAGVKAKPAIVFEFSRDLRPHPSSDPELPYIHGGPRFKTMQLI